MKLLEKYYNEKVKAKGLPRFKDLTDKNKNKLAGTLGFAGYQVLYAVDNFKKNNY